jgi:hypothetical protein
MLLTHPAYFIGQTGALQHHPRQAVNGQRTALFVPGSNPEEHQGKDLPVSVGPRAFAPNEVVHDLSRGNGIESMGSHFLDSPNTKVRQTEKYSNVNAPLRPSTFWLQLVH